MSPLFLPGKQGESGANSTTAGASEARSKSDVVPPQMSKAFSSDTALVRWQWKMHPDLLRPQSPSPSCTRGFILGP